MKFLLIAITVLAVGISSGCNAVFKTIPGSGVAKTEVRTVDEFNAISFGGTSDVTVTVGQKQSVTVKVDDNLLEIVQTEVSDGMLDISTTGNYNTSIGLKINITVPSLEEANTSGVSKLLVEGVSGPAFKLDISGAGSAQIVGNIDKLDVTVSGTAKAKLRELKSKMVTANTSGSSSAEVFGADAVNANASGTSSITIFGNPTDVKQDASGVAKIEVAQSTKNR